MFYLSLILIVVLIILSIKLLKLNNKLKSDADENSLLKDNDNKNSFLNDSDNNKYPNEKPEFQKNRVEEELINKSVSSEYVTNQNENKQQYYYVVKEIVKNKIHNSILSSNEYSFVNENLFSSKTEARLYYDSKVENQSIHEENNINEYELYIINDVFYDSSVEASSNHVKKYLLIDNKGREQIEGRNFESFVLNKFSNKIMQSNRDNNQGFFINTKNSFLEGKYKD
jgi:hypothetical protein